MAVTVQTQVTIQPLNRKIITVPIQGTSTLICNRFSEDQIKGILDKQMKKGNKGREAKDPQRLFEQSMYPTGKKGEFGFPASGFKKAMVSACRNVDGFPMTLARGAFYVIGDIVPIKAKEVRMRQDVVRLGTARNKPADIRFRGEFVDWSAELKVSYNADRVSADQIANLVNIAGFAVGVGDWRPENNGNHGMFEAVAVKQ